MTMRARPLESLHSGHNYRTAAEEEEEGGGEEEEEATRDVVPEVRYLDGDGDFSFVDKYGKEYDPDSLSWRYLGLYLDCDYQDDGDGHSRDQDEDGGDGDGDGSASSSATYCPRTLLWAAYVDRGYRQYRGNGIGDYQIYDTSSNMWDGTTCAGSSGLSRGRCAHLDCHETNTGFELIGLYKETNGMYDWWEQLFKHMGYCVWNDDEDYATMQAWMKEWPDSCQLLDVTDRRGNPLYLDLMPLSGGDMKLAIYTDATCSRVSSNMDYEAYTIKYYKSLGYRNQTGYNVARAYAEAIDTWNGRMNSFKVCQPCIAYNPLGGNRNGQGKNFNCYDKAGATNVNQCYKFGTKTRLEAASEGDLRAASMQGTILKVHAYGRVYGKGGYNAGSSVFPKLMIVAAVLGSAVLLLLHRRTVIRRKIERRGKRWGGRLRESLAGDGGATRSGSKGGKALEDSDVVSAPSSRIFSEAFARGSSRRGRRGHRGYAHRARVAPTRGADRTTSEEDEATNDMAVVEGNDTIANDDTGTVRREGGSAYAPPHPSGDDAVEWASGIRPRDAVMKGANDTTGRRGRRGARMPQARAAPKSGRTRATSI